MIEYKIHTLADIATIKKLWKKFFKNDDTWHFTLEGNYVELRIVEERLDLEDYLAKHKLKYEKFPYHDAFPVVKKYQAQFQQLFHALSEMSMKAPRPNLWIETNSEIRQLVERSTHLVFNIFGYDLSAETRVMASLLLDRSYYFGQYMALRKEPPKFDKLEIVKEKPQKAKTASKKK